MSEADLELRLVEALRERDRLEAENAKLRSQGPRFPLWVRTDLFNACVEYHFHEDGVDSLEQAAEIVVTKGFELIKEERAIARRAELEKLGITEQDIEETKWPQVGDGER